MVCDLAGNILWYYDNVADKSWIGYAFPIKPMMNGHLLASITNLYSKGVPQSIPYNSVLREIDLAGDPIQELYLADLTQKLSTLKTPQGSIVIPLCYSHDVLPLPNGHTILIVQEQRKVTLTQPPGPGQFTILGDALVDLDENFEPVWVWSVFDNLDPNRHPYEFTAAAGYDWTHCNCVQQGPDGNLLLSSRSQNWVLKLNYQGGSGDGAILWRLGYQGDFTLVGKATADTDWFFAQHFPHILSATGTQITGLAVMDNGNDRCYATPGGCPPSDPGPPWPFTRGAIFKIDETAMTASLAWEYLLNQYSVLGRQRRRAPQRRHRDLRLGADPDRHQAAEDRRSVAGRGARARRVEPADRLAAPGDDRRRLPLVPDREPLSGSDLEPVIRERIHAGPERR